MIRTQPHEDDSGFTLMEVLVALAILSLSLGVLLAIFSQSLDRAHKNQLAMEARVLAQALLDQSVAEHDLRPGERRGGRRDGLSWTVSIKPFGTANQKANWRVSLIEVGVDVAWRNGENLHSFELKTLRLASQP